MSGTNCHPEEMQRAIVLVVTSSLLLVVEIGNRMMICQFITGVPSGGLSDGMSLVLPVRLTQLLDAEASLCPTPVC